MATTLASAFTKTSRSIPISNKSTSSIHSEVCASLGRLADLQRKRSFRSNNFLIFDCGALSKKQFEKRQQVILDRHDELASK